MSNEQTAKERDAELVQAAFVCDFIRVRDLLRRGADPNARDDEGRTPIFSAVLGDNIGLLALLLESGCDVNARDNQGFTALHFAAQEFVPEAARLLVAKGANVNAQDEDGNPVLWRAIFSANGQREIIDLLRENGAKDDIPNRTGETPRQLAERLGLNIFTAS